MITSYCARIAFQNTECSATTATSHHRSVRTSSAANAISAAKAPVRMISRRRPLRSASQPQRFGATMRMAAMTASTTPIAAASSPTACRYRLQ